MSSLTVSTRSIIAALDKEDTEAQAAMATHVNTDGWSAELRAFRDLAQRTSIADYVQAVVTERNVQGAAAEYNQHIFDQWHPGDYPLEMLLDRSEFFDFDAAMLQSVQTANLTDEKRAEITGVVNEWWEPVVCRTGCWPESESGLPAGAVSRQLGRVATAMADSERWPPSLQHLCAGCVRDGVQAALSIVNADPARVQHSYEYAAADELQMPGVANNARIRPAHVAGHQASTTRW